MGFNSAFKGLSDSTKAPNFVDVKWRRKRVKPDSRPSNLALVKFQLDAQNSLFIYLFIYNTFIKILYVFRAVRCSSSGGLRRNCIYAASDIVTLCR